MTVLAYDPKTRTIACDSLFNGENRKYYGTKFRVVGNQVMMFAGDQRLGIRAFDLLEAKQPLTQAIIESCSIVVFNTRYGTCFEYDDSITPKRVRRIQAWGSGSDVAIGALAAGADAEYAVTAACAHNITCGGKVHVFRRKDADASRAGTGSVPVRTDSNDVCDAGERREGAGE